MKRTAVLSDCGTYRYQLVREWGDGDRVCWVMLNPSTADAQQDDPTIRRCINFTERWGGGSIVVVNLYAWRTSSPAELRSAIRAGRDAQGPENTEWVRKSLAESELAVGAWGVNGSWYLGERVRLAALDVGLTLQCLGTTLSRCPKHPLYLPKTASVRPWPGQEVG